MISIQEIQEIVARLAISQEETGKQIQDLKRAQEETDEQLKKTDEQLKKTWNMLIGMWVTQGEISEDLVFDNFEKLLEEKWKDLTKIYRNLELPWKAEFDIVWVNWDEVFVTEVKTRLSKKHIDEFVKKRIPSFRKHFPEYSKYKLFWLVWARSIPKDSKEYAFKKWLYVIKEYNNGNAKIINEKWFKLKEFVK